MYFIADFDAGDLVVVEPRNVVEESTEECPVSIDHEQR